MGEDLLLQSYEIYRREPRMQSTLGFKPSNDRHTPIPNGGSSGSSSRLTTETNYPSSNADFESDSDSEEPRARTLVQPPLPFLRIVVPTPVINHAAAVADSGSDSDHELLDPRSSRRDLKGKSKVNG